MGRATRVLLLEGTAIATTAAVGVLVIVVTQSVMIPPQVQAMTKANFLAIVIVVTPLVKIPPVQAKANFCAVVTLGSLVLP
jgi:hypothetical protein